MPDVQRCSMGTGGGAFRHRMHVAGAGYGPVGEVGAGCIGGRFEIAVLDQVLGMRGYGQAADDERNRTDTPYPVVFPTDAVKTRSPGHPAVDIKTWSVS